MNRNVKLQNRIAMSFAALLAVALLSVPAVAEPTVPVIGGNTRVALDGDFLMAVGPLSPTPIAPGSLDAKTLSLIYPIPGGALDLGSAKGDIYHNGGLSLSDGMGSTVDLRQFIIDTTGPDPVLTGLVSLNGSVLARLPLFDLTIMPDKISVTPANTVIVDEVVVTLNPTAATALNDIFGTALPDGFPVGVATVTAQGPAGGGDGGADDDESADDDDEDEDDDDRRRWRSRRRR